MSGRSTWPWTARILDVQWKERGRSSWSDVGAEYALTQWWRARGQARAVAQQYDHFAPADRVLALSGSASRLSAQQIDAAVAAGFADIPVDAAAIVDDARWPGAAAELISAATTGLNRGRSVILIYEKARKRTT